MTDDQAQEIVTLLRAATGGQPDETKIEYFQVALGNLDYDAALSAATTGSSIWRFFPSWAEFKELYRAEMRGRKVNEPPPPAAKYGVAAPEWVAVWRWARGKRSPRCLIPFPQQGLPESEPQLSMEEYEALREEWVEAGSPRADTPLPLTREV